MKTVLAFALVALSALSLQAVTVTQYDTTTITDFNQDVETFGDASTSNCPQVFSVGAILQIDNLSSFTSTSTNLVTMYNNTSGSSLGAWLNSIGTVTNLGRTGTTVTYAEGYDADSVKALYKEGYNTIVMTSTRYQNSDSTYTNTITFTVNGETVATALYSGDLAINRVGIALSVGTNLANVDEVYYTNVDTATYEAYDTVTEEMTTAMVTALDARVAQLVPEPTCLALLALGVAGLALRRRA